MSQNIVPIHIAFIPLIVPPLLSVMNRLHLDRRAITCILTFGLVNTYMFIPYGFGDIFLNQIILKNINEAGMITNNISMMQTMMIPALGMLIGLLIAILSLIVNLVIIKKKSWQSVMRLFKSVRLISSWQWWQLLRHLSYS